MILTTFPSTIEYLAHGDYKRVPETARLCGLDAIDFCPSAFKKLSAREQKALLSENGLKPGQSFNVKPNLCSQNEDLRRADIADMKMFMQDLTIVECKQFMIVGGSIVSCADETKKQL